MIFGEFVPQGTNSTCVSARGRKGEGRPQGSGAVATQLGKSVPTISLDLNCYLGNNCPHPKTDSNPKGAGRDAARRDAGDDQLGPAGICKTYKLKTTRNRHQGRRTPRRHDAADRPVWIKSKNPACEAVRREGEEDWGR
jgi:hypothetical protein